MRTYFDCIPCFVRQTLDVVRLITDDEQIHEKVMREMLCLGCEMDLRQSPPAIASKIHRMIRKLTGVCDPYLEVKNHFNKLALKMYPELRQRIETTVDPLEMAIRLAIAGNIIDLGVNAVLEESNVEKAIDESLTSPLDTEALEEFRNATAHAREILYIGDNAGEIVFDRLLIEQLTTENITFVVKGAPIINDATIEDAQIAGLTDIVNVIDNGSDAPGTILETCSQDFRRRFNEADLIIAKGQGNYETLSDADKDVFFILRAKCPVIARHLGCEIGDLVLKKNKVVVGNKENLEERS
ncbi:MAG: hypothetical protein AMJ43_00385 [Coxiella sp. DG_40]|nr:MAG: hypothetical protein AMJ43_00385 [Coxiella sp. DG_40]